MTEQEFYLECEHYLSGLATKIENEDKNSNLDVEYFDGILSIAIVANDKTFVINRHAASRKIWYSSPFSGADYFSFDELSKGWISERSEELSDKLLLEIKSYFS